MTRPNWTLQEAEAHLGAVVEAASHGEPQTITLHGGASVVVVATRDYARLNKSASPVPAEPNFIDHLLAMPQEPAGPSEQEPTRLSLRDPGL